MSSHQDATTACRHLGRQIRGIREGRGLSDRGLAVEAGMLPSTVIAIEDGHPSIPIGTIARVANALGCELSISPRGATVTPIADRLAKQGSRVWHQGDPEPEAVTVVQDHVGDEWERQGGYWYFGADVKQPVVWDWLLECHGPLTEVS